MDHKQREWDEYFMKIAETVATKSKDPSSKMGCVIVDEKKRVVSLGYNGMLQGADESKMTLSERPMKYYFAIHSEMNALIFARQDLTGCTVYNKVAPIAGSLQTGDRRVRPRRGLRHGTPPASRDVPGVNTSFQALSVGRLLPRLCWAWPSWAELG